MDAEPYGMRQDEAKGAESENHRAAGSTSREDSPRLSEDVRLVEGVLAGDEEASQEFLQRMRCIPRMIGSIVKRRGPALDAEERFDVSQEVFSRIWSHLDRFSGRSSLESWAFGYCALVLAERRRARRTLSTEAIEITPAAPPPAELAEDERELIHGELARLAPALRVVVDLKHFEGLSFPELSRRLGISPNTAKTRYYRAISTLEGRLRSAFPGPRASSAEGIR